VIGVEPDDAPTLYRALEANRRVILKQVGIFADGVAVRQIGKETFRVARKVVDEVVLVSADEMCAAIKDIFDDTRTIAEPAGALSVAGLKKYVAREGVKDVDLVAIESGANINFDRLRHVAERAEFGERREALFAVQIPERPGSFLQFCKLIGKRSITEFNYRYSDTNTAQIFVGVELRQGDKERDELIGRFEEKNYSIVDMTDNETAKLHIRYMVGGHATGLEDESLVRFEFPERPGALMFFLSSLGNQWNISLFHYRNHGAAYGRVLMGIQVPAIEKGNFIKLLKGLDYPFWDESNNPAYQLFAGVGQH
jgi:threonine dehydratase